MISVLSTAIDVKAKIIATKNGPSQWLSSSLASFAVMSEALSPTRSPGYRRASARRRAATAAGWPVSMRISFSSEVVW